MTTENAQTFVLRREYKINCSILNTVQIAKRIKDKMALAAISSKEWYLAPKSGSYDMKIKLDTVVDFLGSHTSEIIHLAGPR